MSDNSQIDYKELWLEAFAEVQEIFREVMEELDEPIADERARQIWSSLPDHIKEQIDREDDTDQSMN